MKCTEIEKYIYLYPELDPDERNKADNHLETCPSCQQLMATVTATRKAVAEIKTTPAPDTSPWLTDRIMQNIARTQRVNPPVWSRVIQALLTPSFRHAMAGLSFGLILLFVSEYRTSSPPQLTRAYGGWTVNEIELNLAAFHAAFLESRKLEQPGGATLSKCIASCRNDHPTACISCQEKFVIHSNTGK